MNLSSEGFIPVEGGNVYYRKVAGGPGTPLLVLHGGPGFAHGLLETLKALSNERPVIFYDQLGAGKSDRPKDPSLWQIERFVRELAQVRQSLGLDRVVLYGHSWGTMLAVDYMLTAPRGVEALILSSPCLSAKMWKSDADRLRLTLSTETQATLIRHETAGSTHSEEYQNAMWDYLKKFACRLDPIPEAVLAAFADGNMECYTQMWGPSEFHPTGNLKDYDRTPDLHRLQVPTYFVCGEFDEATPESTRKYAELAKARDFRVIPDCSHSALIENEGDYLKIIRDFCNIN